jgi:hypothetical protein
LELLDLPTGVEELLEILNIPDRLKRHLRIVHSTAFDILTLLKVEWPFLELDQELILFGAATHDIGKTMITDEIYESGKRHELTGMTILLNHGFTKEESRFALTHGNWQDEGLKIEDLLVALSDKIWKGERIDDLEELLGQKLSSILNCDYWDVYGKLDSILSQIALGADEKLNWQGH